jgi:hypothetical protein
MLKDTSANKIFLIILVLILALSFSLYKGWEERGKPVFLLESMTMNS